LNYFYFNFPALRTTYFFPILLLSVCFCNAQKPRYRFLGRHRFDRDENYTRVTTGLEQSDFFNHSSVNTKGSFLEMEIPFENRNWSRTYKLGGGTLINNIPGNNIVYVHLPGGSAILFTALVLLGGNGSRNSGNSNSYKYIFAIPEGFGYTPWRNRFVKAGFYANFISADVYLREYGKGYMDYAPDAGVRANFYPFKKGFIYLRAGGKYSARNGVFGVQGTIGIGFDFWRSRNAESCYD
jgi:hypothetical protein